MSGTHFKIAIGGRKRFARVLQVTLRESRKMRKLLATCVVGLFVVGSANGQIRIFFDTEGVGEQEDRGTVDPLSYGNPEVDGTAGPVRLYLYGEFLGENDLWLALNFDITADGSATLSDPTMYNHRNGNGPRWSSSSGAMNGDTASFRSAWIGNPNQFPNGMWNWDEPYATARTGNPFNAADNADDKHYRRGWDSQNGELGTTLLGYIDVDGDDGSLWLTIASPGFGFGGQHQIYFGYGDAPIPGFAYGVRTEIADATVVPEPASLMLLGLGVLAVRRR